MASNGLITALRIGVPVVILAGLAIILMPQLERVFLLTSAGVVLIILGLLGLMPLVRYALAPGTDPARRDRPEGNAR